MLHRGFLDQTLSFKNHEVIVIDDNSTDRSMDYISGHKHLRDYLRVFRNKVNIGPGYCSNLAIRKAKGKKEYDALEFLKLVKQKAKDLKFEEKNLNRQLNVGFSGGEKKRNEILQMALLEPKLSLIHI